MCFTYIIKCNFVVRHGNDLAFLSHCLLDLFGQCLVGFGCIAFVRPSKNNCNHLAK